jgi:hypothetical protein
VATGSRDHVSDEEDRRQEWSCYEA